MKVDKEFAPVTIVLERESEVRAMWVCLNIRSFDIEKFLQTLDLEGVIGGATAIISDKAYMRDKFNGVCDQPLKFK